MFSPAPIRVAIVEDDEATRDGLSRLIGGTPGFRVVGGYGSIEQAEQSLGHALPDVLLLDIHLPGTPGSVGARQLKQKYPAVQIIMLTVYDSDDRILESICNGASGYLLKKTPPAEILSAIQEVREGGSPMSSEVARKVVEFLRETRVAEAPDAELTPQEVRLLKLLAEGYSYQAAGARLNITANTVRNYIRSIYDKMQVHSRSEAVSKALRRRIIA